jgi:hypothetical protein
MSFRTCFNWLRVSFAIVLVVTVGGFAWFALHSSEPVYQGRTLTSWLNQYATNSPDIPIDPVPAEVMAFQNGSIIAIQQIGTNAVPILIRMAAVHDSELKSNVMVLAKRLLPIRPHSAEEYHKMSVMGFYILGPIGKSAVPSLIKLLKSPYEDVRGTAADGLGDIGPEAKAAVPFLIPFLNNSDYFVRWDATVNLGRIHSLPDLVVPELIKNLIPSNGLRSAITIKTLGEFGKNAKAAVPSLMPFLNDKDQYVRYRTTNALKQIDPEAAAKAGIK